MSKTKPELEAEVMKLKKENERLINDKSLFISNASDLKRLAEKAGSERAAYQKQAFILEEQVESLQGEIRVVKSQLNALKVSKDGK